MMQREEQDSAAAAAAAGRTQFRSRVCYQLVEERGLRMSSLAVSSDRL